MANNFALLDTEYGEENVVKQPRSARHTRGNHRYDGTIVNNKAVGYVPVVYEHQVYPRMMYHPKWGMKPKPDSAKFFIGCVTPDQFTAAFASYQAAEQDWMRGNRVKLAENEADEKRLTEKGWLLQPPLQKGNKAQFDLNSEEI